MSSQKERTKSAKRGTTAMRTPSAAAAPPALRQKTLQILRRFLGYAMKKAYFVVGFATLFAEYLASN